jgi:hypothetical protein
MVVILERIPEKNLLVRAAEDFLDPASHVAGRNIGSAGDHEQRANAEPNCQT